jgi:hypothetical protein
MEREEHRLRMFDIGVIKYLYPRGEVTGILKKLHIDKLYKFYSLSDNTRIVNSKNMRCAGYLVYVGEKRSTPYFWYENVK